jgi:hypothetical protein
MLLLCYLGSEEMFFQEDCMVGAEAGREILRI